MLTRYHREKVPISPFRGYKLCVEIFTITYLLRQWKSPGAQSTRLWSHDAPVIIRTTKPWPIGAPKMQAVMLLRNRE